MFMLERKIKVSVGIVPMSLLNTSYRLPNTLCPQGIMFPGTEMHLLSE
jgi:hypothetical protein